MANVTDDAESVSRAKTELAQSRFDELRASTNLQGHSDSDDDITGTEGADAASVIDAYGNNASYAAESRFYFLLNVEGAGVGVYQFETDTGGDDRLVTDEIKPVALLTGQAFPTQAQTPHWLPPFPPNYGKLSLFHVLKEGRGCLLLS